MLCPKVLSLTLGTVEALRVVSRGAIRSNLAFQVPLRWVGIGQQVERLQHTRHCAWVPVCP